MSLILDKADRDQLVSNLKGALVIKPPATIARAASYAAYSTICVGKNAGVYVVTNFRMHLDLLDAVFDDCQYNTVGINDGTNNLFVFKRVPPVATATPRAASRSKNSTTLQIKKKTGSRAFMGNRFKFKVPATKAALLYPVGFKMAKPRKTATMLFPYIATNPQVAAWFSTHQTPGGINIGALVSEKGTRIGIPTAMTTATHDAEIGIFDLATKARLDGTKKGVELQSP